MIVKSGFVALVLLGCGEVAGAADTRIRSQAYQPDQIVKIVGKTGIQSTIQFDADERIENVAIGDYSKWEITPNRGATLCSSSRWRRAAGPT
jgi:type IV secretion system protein VirB9